MSVRRQINILLGAVVAACCLCGHMAISDEPPVYRLSVTTSPASAPVTRASTQAASRAAEDELPQVPGLPPRMVARLIEMARTDPQIKQQILRTYPQLAKAMKAGASTKPKSRPAVTVASLEKVEKIRQQAEALVAKLATADDKAVEQIEKQLGHIGKEAMLPLKLAELSSNFELRKRARRIAARLRWRQVCPAALLKKHAGLVGVMSGADRKARADLVDQITKTADSNALAFLGECLADAQDYVRQRAIDGLVAIYPTEPTGNAGEFGRIRREICRLLESVLDDDNRNIRLLAIGAMAKIRAVSPARLAQMLDDDSMEIRATVIKAMGFSRNPEAVKYVSPLLKDPQWRIRAAALEALDNLVDRDKSGGVAPAVAEMLADDDSFVRGLAAKTLGRWGYQKAAAKLLQIVKEGKIGEEVGYRSLVSMRDPTARKRLLGLYDSSSKPARKAHLLNWLDRFDPDPAIDDRLSKALRDKSMASQLPRIIEQAGGREKWRDHLAQICKHLEHEDQNIALAAWEAVRYRSDEQAMPPDIMARLFQSNMPRRAEWALMAAYSQNDSNYPKYLRRAMDHAKGQVVELAIGMVGKQIFQDGFGMDVPEYRRERPTRSMGFMRTGKKPETRPHMDLAKLVEPKLSHKSPRVKLLAAAVLFRSGLRSDGTVTTLLRDGLKSGDPKTKGIALAGITENPKPFVQDLDLPVLVRNEDTSSRAFEIMSNLGAEKYTHLLGELAEQADADDFHLLRLLVQSSDDRLVAIAIEKFESASSYVVLGFVRRHLVNMKGRGAVKFVQWAVMHPKLDTWDRRAVIQTLVSLPDKSVKDALRQVLEDVKKKKEFAEDRTRTQTMIMARLVQLDPGASIGLYEMLTSKDPDQQAATIEAIVQSKATDNLIILALKGAKAKGKDLTREWVQLVEWLPEKAFLQQFLPAMNDVNHIVRGAMLRRLGRSPAPKDLNILVGVASRDTYTREYVAGLIALLTVDKGAARPKLAALPPASLANVLSAAGDWPDATKVVGPYLNDRRKAVASAARIGLAYHIVGNPAAPVTDIHRRALLAEVRSKDAAGAYLAAEALALKGDQHLLELTADEIPDMRAALRVAVAHGSKLSQGFRKKVASALRGKVGSITKRLALISAAQAYDAQIGKALRPRSYANVPLVADAAVAAGREDILQMLISLGFPGELIDRKGAKPLIQRLIKKARTSDNRLFVLLATRGYIDKPQEGDIYRLLRSQPMLEPEDEDRYYPGMSPYRMSGNTVLDTALMWAPPTPDKKILSMVSPESYSGVLAAAIAAIKWDLPAGRKALIAAAVQPPPPPKRSTSRQMLLDIYVATSRPSSRPLSMPTTTASPDHIRRHALAIRALSICAYPQDADALMPATNQMILDRWRTRDMYSGPFLMLARIAPNELLKRLKGARSKSGRADMRTSILAVLLADEKMPHDDDLEFSDYGMLGLEMLPALMAARRAVQKPATAPATSVARSQPATQESVPVAFLMPPWGSRSTEFSEPVGNEALARGRLAGILEAIKLFQRRDEQVDPDIEDIGDIEELPYGLTPAMRARLRAHMMGAEEYGLGSIFTHSDPVEEHYMIGTGNSDRNAIVPVYVPAAELDGKLRPLFADKSQVLRTSLMRLAAAWQVASLADVIAKRLAGESQEVVEAAWALAWLQGLDSVDRIAAAYRREKDFTYRVRLACLLRMLGSDVGRGDIDRAVVLRTIRFFRMKAIAQHSGPADDENMLYYLYARTPPYFDSPLMPWNEALAMAADDLLLATDNRFPLLRRPPMPQLRKSKVPPAAQSNLSHLRIAGGTLTGPQLVTNRLPMAPLACSNTYTYRYTYRAPIFVHLPMAEQSLEQHFYVQFADRAHNLVELRKLWLAWWHANKNKPRRDWWRQATRQAVAQLTHKRWWYRQLAARRLMRLTGRRFTVPNVFDLAKWSAAQQQWRERLAGDQADSPRKWLLKAGIEAGVLKTGSLAHSRNDEAYLDDLIRLAGSAQWPLAETALLQLQTWPDAAQLIRRSLPWQNSPRRRLASWARLSLQRLTGKTRLVYTEADLPGSSPPAR